MSTTTTTTTVEAAQHQLGRIRYKEPDISGDPMKKGYLEGYGDKSITYSVLPLHNFREDVFSESPRISLETHAFTAVKHNTALLSPTHEGDPFMDPEMIEKIYVPELEEMIRTVTGARKIIVIRSALRSQKSGPDVPKVESLSPDANKPTTHSDINSYLASLDLTKPTYKVLGRGKVTPVRDAHCDYSLRGIRSEIRQGRHDIKFEAEDIIAAEDQTPEDGRYEGRRYAVYSVWRPLKPVARDPLAKCDPSSINEQSILENGLKRPGINGPYLSNTYNLSGEQSERQKWYWLKDQQPDEVLILQFFDSHAKQEGRPFGVFHASPELIGVDNVDHRESFEVRCIAFW